MDYIEYIRIFLSEELIAQFLLFIFVTKYTLTNGELTLEQREYVS